VTEKVAKKTTVPTILIGTSVRARVLFLRMEWTHRLDWINCVRSFGQADVLAIRRVLVAAAP
jgi:hypothetical protein